MNIPLYSKKKIGLVMVKTILDEYLNARKSGLPVIQSKRWAVYAGESVRFGRGIPYTHYKEKPVPYLKSRRREKSVWYRGTSIHAKESTFDRLMRGTLGTTQFFGQPRTVNGWMLSALRRHDKKLYVDLKRAAKNYKNIIGKSPSLTNPRFLDVYRQWLKIRRGRDLFVRGFGKFDITAAVKKIEYPEFISRPFEITAHGYNLHPWRFKQLMEIPVLRRYYLKYKSFWQENQARLDEIFRDEAIHLIQLQLQDMTPERLLYELEIMRQRQWLSPRDTSPEPFAHLAEAPSVETPFGVLRPVKSPREVIEVGSAMRNCATNYIGMIRQKATMLLALFDESGKPVALGEVHYDREAKRWVWGQRLGPENKNLEKNIYEVFQTYPLIKSGIWEHVKQDQIAD